MNWDENTIVLVNNLITGYSEFDINDVPKILPKLIIHVEKIKTLDGNDKKNMIIEMLNHIVDKTDGPGDDAVWDPIIKNMIPGVIDLLLEVNDGKLKLRKSCLLQCCRK